MAKRLFGKLYVQVLIGVTLGVLIGVLDLDSPKLARFGEHDQVGLERLAQIFLASTDC